MAGRSTGLFRTPGPFKKVMNVQTWEGKSTRVVWLRLMIENSNNIRRKKSTLDTLLLRTYKQTEFLCTHINKHSADDDGCFHLFAASVLLPGRCGGSRWHPAAGRLRCGGFLLPALLRPSTSRLPVEPPQGCPQPWPLLHPWLRSSWVGCIRMFTVTAEG